ncbi:MAG: hypothetical protein KZQ70_14250 [gamma proteobacterium symbiont of Lucinoma myriamae]|nr:hypothetical protein [gamma proteobacterium symbiont of Lucinoma myriamae]MCU7818284.1 hypothetical protein [gamma proteobacterium symbiont of Lucinoma myriamae]
MNTNKIIISSLLLLFFMPIVSYAAPATILYFSEHEQGSDEVLITMTITEQYLRIDDRLIKTSNQETEENKGFVLFDRKNKEIYSVSYEEQQIIKIKYAAVTIPSPIKLKLNILSLKSDKNAPLIKGKKTQQKQIYVNDKLCSNMITIPGLMPDAVTALKNFNQVLAGQQAETLRYIPGDPHEACDLARHSFYPQSHLENGFPMVMQTIGESGKIEDVKSTRVLLDFKQQVIADDFFSLPEYDIFKIN